MSPTTSPALTNDTRAWLAIDRPKVAWVTVLTPGGRFFEVILVRSPDQVLPRGDSYVIYPDELGSVVVCGHGPAADERGALRFDCDDFDTELWLGDPILLAEEAVRRVFALGCAS